MIAKQCGTTEQGVHSVGVVGSNKLSTAPLEKSQRAGRQAIT
jgi:hypothetical protein